MSLVDWLNSATVLLACATAFAWIKAATARVMRVNPPKGDDPVGMIVFDGGHFTEPGSGGIFQKTKAGWIDLPDTLGLQSTWNARAAWLSAATACTQGAALLVPKLGL